MDGLKTNKLSGVMFNAYPDSIGGKLENLVSFLERPELRSCFSLFYVLPSFFHSDLDRGFSVIDYDPDEKFVGPSDLERLKNLGIGLKFDLVLNHLSVASPEFKDLLEKGEDSAFKDFFIDWNEFWKGHGEMSPEGYIIPKPEYLSLLFMRKPGLPILFVRFPDGTERPYWNTFYNEVKYQPLEVTDLEFLADLDEAGKKSLLNRVNEQLLEGQPPTTFISELGLEEDTAQAVLSLIERKRTYLGQMDLNANSPKVWDYYERAFAKVSSYGGVMVRLDAFAYLHKQPGRSNFFNVPETWDFLRRLKEMAAQHGLLLLPEIHKEYGSHLHNDVAAKDFYIYDFFLPGLLIHTIDTGNCDALLRWIDDIVQNDLHVVNMLGCHDGIPVLDLKHGNVGEGLLSESEIEAVIQNIMDRGGYMKNLYGPDGKKIAYYQVNATYLSALGEDPRKMRLARAVQLFMPGIPQVWYLDLVCGTNDYEAIEKAGVGGHKAINRTDLSMTDVEERLKLPLVVDQLDMIRLRNVSPAFNGSFSLKKLGSQRLFFEWVNGASTATLDVDFSDYVVKINSEHDGGEMITLAYS